MLAYSKGSKKNVRVTQKYEYIHYESNEEYFDLLE